MKHNMFWLSARLAALVIGFFVLSGAATAHHLSPVDQYIDIKRIEVPTDVRLQALVRVAMQREVQAVKVAVQRQHALKVSQISWSPEKLVVVGHRLVHQADDRAGTSMWLEQVRITVPRQHLANTWDVHSLQKELERLGIKVKPKPQVPRPAPQISG